MAVLFEKGLPVRGAISIGCFYVRKGRQPLFLGKSIVEAYEMCNSLDLSGCVLSLPAERMYADQFGLLVYPFSVSLNGVKQQLYLLDYFNFLREKNVAYRQKVIDSFSAHNKKLPLKVIGKVNNTVAFLEYCQRRNEERMGFKTCQVTATG